MRCAFNTVQLPIGDFMIFGGSASFFSTPSASMFDGSKWTDVACTTRDVALRLGRPCSSWAAQRWSLGAALATCRASVSIWRRENGCAGRFRPAVRRGPASTRATGNGGSFSKAAIPRLTVHQAPASRYTIRPRDLDDRCCAVNRGLSGGHQVADLYGLGRLRTHLVVPCVWRNRRRWSVPTSGAMTHG